MLLRPLFAASALLTILSGAGELDDLRQQRLLLAQRRHRVIFDNDGMDAQFVGEPTAEALLAVRTTQLVGTGVTTVFYCSRSSGLGVFTHNTKVGEVFDSRDGRYKDNITGDLIRQGTDPLRVVADYCRSHDLEVFWTLRMNDCHDAVHRPDKPYPAFSKLKAAHPDWLLGTYRDRPAYGNWSAYDFAIPDVRQLALDCVAEVCREYDVDGIHLDFFRHLNYFREVAAGDKASPEHMALMTELVRDIRRRTEEAALARKRPFLLAVRVPDSVEYCQALGLDVERWLREGLVDLLVVGEFQLRPWQESVALGHRYGAQVIAGLSEGRVSGERAPFRRDARESYRARAAAAWQAGCDGLYIFNFYKAERPVLSEMQDPALLKSLAQWHFATIRSQDEARRWLADGPAYATKPLLTPEHPWVLHPGETQTITLELGDPDGRPGVLHALPSMPGSSIRATIGGRAVAALPSEKGWLRYQVPADVLRPGLLPVDLRLESLGKEGQTFLAADIAKIWGVRGVRKSQSVFEEITPEGLRIVDQGTGQGEYHYRSFGWAVQPGGKASVVVRAKHVRGWSSFAFANGRNEDRLMLFPDRIRLRDSGLEYPMDTTDGFHDYRVEIDGNDVMVAVDGKRRIEGKGRYTGAASGNRTMILLGAATSSETGEGIWQKVVVETPDVALQDLVLVLPDRRD
jgi:hypothetical protein